MYCFWSSDFPASKKRRSRRLNTLQVKQLMDGQEIYNALVNAQDPQAIQVGNSSLDRRGGRGWSHDLANLLSVPLL